MKCIVDSNPEPYKVIWRKNNHPLESSGHGKRLHLPSVKPSHEGNYTCVASNVEGDGISPSLALRVLHVPVCQSEEPKKIYAAIGEEKMINCLVKSQPKPICFEWWIPHSSKVTESLSKGISMRPIRRQRDIKPCKSSGSARTNVSRILFTPRDDHYFGRILCSAQNEVGKQKKACVFELVPAVPPSAPSECRTYNLSSSEVTIKCLNESGESGNVTFFLDVFGGDQRVFVQRLSAPVPMFRVRELDAESVFHISIYARDERSESNVTSFTIRTLRDPLRQLEARLEAKEITEKSSGTSFLGYETASIVGALTGGIVMIFVILIFAGLFSMQKKRKSAKKIEPKQPISADDSNPKQDSGAEKRPFQPGAEEEIQIHECDEDGREDGVDYEFTSIVEESTPKPHPSEQDFNIKSILKSRGNDSLRSDLLEVGSSDLLEHSEEGTSESRVSPGIRTLGLLSSETGRRISKEGDGSVVQRLRWGPTREADIGSERETALPSVAKTDAFRIKNREPSIEEESSSHSSTHNIEDSSKLRSHFQFDQFFQPSQDMQALLHSCSTEESCV